MRKNYSIIASLLVLSILGWSFCADARGDQSVRQAQIQLRELGYDPGPADGIMGRQTIAALKQFQRDRDLPVTGKLDAATREQLDHQEALPPAHKENSPEKQRPSSSHIDKQTVRQAQIRLRDLGYDPGPADGIMGRQTIAALKQFQRDRDLPVTGRLDKQTQQQLDKPAHR